MGSEEEQQPGLIPSEFAFLLGSLIIAASSGVGMTYAFRSNFLITYLSFVCFIFGYKLAQMGYHNGKKTVLIFIQDIEKINEHKTNLVSFLGGSIFISLGFILLGRSVTQLSVLLGLTSGMVIGGGYILSHWAVNNRLV
jgi:hypothetical protein